MAVEWNYQFGRERVRIKTREKILCDTLELAVQKGLGMASLSMIAEKVGIRKATIYSHFQFKDEMIQSLYAYLREKVEKKPPAALNYDARLQGKKAEAVLTHAVESYMEMNAQKEMEDLYKFIYSERAINPSAAMIMLSESETMLRRTRALFEAMEKTEILNFEDKDIDLAATMFCLTVHELMDMERDHQLTGQPNDFERLRAFVAGF